MSNDGIIWQPWSSDSALLQWTCFMSAQFDRRSWNWFGFGKTPAEQDRTRRPRPSPRPPRHSTVVPSHRESVGEPIAIGPKLMPATSWAYQLQNIDVATIAACPADVVVIDTSPDGNWREDFTPAQVARMKTRPGGAPNKKLIAYMSIGEAEEKRFYWHDDWVGGDGKRKTDRAPKWMDALNGQWRGNWKVRFWEPAWQANIVGADGCFLDRIIAQGFDGVYLDIIDAYDYWMERERGAGMRPSADAEMVAFVRRICDHARNTRGCREFAVIPQNGEGLLAFPQYRAAISAIGKEDILFDQAGHVDNNPRVKPRPDNGIEEIMGYLRLALADRIPILSVEYLRDRPEDRSKIAPTLTRMRAAGLIPHFGERALRTLSETTPPLEAGGLTS
jgi:cysteinyl-tRNA synthetase, unknown class